MALVDYEATGGSESGGSGIYSHTHNYEGSSGSRSAGNAIVAFDSLLGEAYTATGGSVSSGTSVVSFYSSGGILENKDWSLETDTPEEFLYGRLLHQKNPIATKDIGPVEIGDLTEGLVNKEYRLLYSTSAEEFLLNDEVLFTAPEATKLDLTFDVWGYPVVVYVDKSGTLRIRYWDINVSAYSTKILEQEGASQAFVCLAERRLPWSYNNNKVYVVYSKNEEILSREFLINEYGTPYQTFLTENRGSGYTIQGMGLTEDYRLQVIVNYKYSGST